MLSVSIVWSTRAYGRRNKGLWLCVPISNGIGSFSLYGNQIEALLPICFNKLLSIVLKSQDLRSYTFSNVARPLSIKSTTMSSLSLPFPSLFSNHPLYCQVSTLQCNSAIFFSIFCLYKIRFNRLALSKEKRG